MPEQLNLVRGDYALVTLHRPSNVDDAQRLNALSLFLRKLAQDQGIEKVKHPHHVDSPVVAIAVLGVAIVLEGFSFRTAMHEANPLRDGASWISFIRHTKNPELPVVLLEDSGALVGLVLAMFGVVLADVTGNPRWDGVGTLAIGVLLGVIAVVLGFKMKSLLIGEGASAPDVAEIRAALLDDPIFRRVIHIRTLYLGPDEMLVAAKIAVDPAATPR